MFPWPVTKLLICPGELWLSLKLEGKNEEMKQEGSEAGICGTHYTNWESYNCHATLLCKLFMPQTWVTTKSLTE